MPGFKRNFGRQQGKGRPPRRKMMGMALPRTILKVAPLALALAFGASCRAPAPPARLDATPSGAEAVPAAAVAANASASGQAAIAARAPASPAQTAGTTAQGDTCGLRATLTAKGGHPHALKLTNGGKKTLRLVVPGDGSGEGWRSPVLTWTTDKVGVDAKSGRCGMMNQILANEVFTLAPGESRQFTDWLGSPDFVPGTYDVRLRYRNEPSIASSKGRPDPDVARELAQSSSCDVTSNTIAITISPPP